MADRHISGFYHSYFRYPDRSTCRRFPNQFYRYQFDILSYWRFPSYGTYRQSGCTSLVRICTLLQYELELTDRANRAQFADVYLRHINEDDEVPEIGVPTVQGVQDDIGMSFLAFAVIHADIP